jgi:hypothetical protein
MTLAPDSITITDPDATPTATKEHAGISFASKFHPLVGLIDADGHMQGTAPAYQLFQMPRVTTGAATDFFDLFNAVGSGKIIRLRKLFPILEITAASAIVNTFRFDMFRTSAVGSGGTAAAFESASAPAAGNIALSRWSTADAAALPAQITARALPTAGATPSAYYFSTQLQTEETNPSTTLVQGINLFPELPLDQAYELQEGQGFKVRQITALASTGTNFGWLLVFVVIP